MGWGSVKRFWGVLVLCVMWASSPVGVADSLMPENSELAGSASAATFEAERAKRHDTLAQASDVVALIEVTHVNSLINHAMSRPGVLSVQAYAYQFDVARHWKGDLPLDGMLRVDVNHCVSRLYRGERYVVMGMMDAGQWVAPSCDHVVALADAGSLLARLDRLFQAQLAQQ